LWPVKRTGSPERAAHAAAGIAYPACSELASRMCWGSCLRSRWRSWSIEFAIWAGDSPATSRDFSPEGTEAPPAE
jgi:hypothetical protein